MKLIVMTYDRTIPDLVRFREEVVQRVIIQTELTLERSVGDTPLSLQHPPGNRQAFEKVH